MRAISERCFFALNRMRALPTFTLRFVALSAIAVLYLVLTGSVQAQFKSDFLYKFHSRWSDIVVNNAGTRFMVLNESYSRIEEYDASTGVLQNIYGGFGTGNVQFNRPQGIAVDSSGNIYVADTGNHRIVKLDSSFAYVAQWGSYGSSAGQFSSPADITTDGTTYVFIADTDNNRVQRCTLAGASCTTWGGLGTADGMFSSPKSLVYNPNDLSVYIADTGNNRIQEFNTSGVFQSAFGSYGTGTGAFSGPFRIAVDTSSGGNFFIMDGLNRVQRFDSGRNVDMLWTLTSSGATVYVYSNTLYVVTLPHGLSRYNSSTGGAVDTLTIQDIGQPVDVSLDSSGNIYVNNNFSPPVIQKFSPLFLPLAEWTGSSGAFSAPMGIGVNTGDQVCVADTGNNRVQKYSSTGDYLSVITPTIGPFNNPKDVATETTGKTYVADTNNGRILKFDSLGNYIWNVPITTVPTPAAGSPTPLPNATPAPYGITVDELNKIYVADAGFHRILRFDANGTYEATWGVYGSADSSTLPQLDTPQGMAIDSDQYIYVADTGNNRIQRFDQDGALATRVVWGSYGTQDGKFDQPRNVAVDSSDRVYVSEVGNRRIQVFGNAAASAGITITQTNGTTIAEGTSATDPSYLIDTYTVRLNTQPSANVTLTITPSDATDATVSNPTLVFTPTNWYQPQVVTVIPVHDSIAEGTHSVSITHIPTSIDTNYNSATSWSSVAVSINDTVDIAEVRISDSTVAGTEGTAFSNAYSVVLNTKPTANVTITLTPDSSVQVYPETITFTSATNDWNTPRFVTLNPVHDSVAQGTHVGIINHSSASTDANYDGTLVVFRDASDNSLTANTLITITDTDVAGVTLSKTSVTTVENGTQDTYTVNLSSKPLQDVQIVLVDDGATDIVSISPSTLTFTNAGWSGTTGQTVTVSAVHDYLKNPVNPRTTTISHTVSSGDATYNGMTVTDVNASVTDSDTSSVMLYKQAGGAVSINETGATDTYLMELTSIPTGNVTVTITELNNQATTSAYFYTFTPSNWNTPQYATASAINDALEEGAHVTNLVHTLASTDSNFNGVVATMQVSISDDDTSGISLTPIYGAINLTESGPTDTLQVKLDSQPSSFVTVKIDNNAQATASPALMVFDSTNWNVIQEATISAIQDFIVEGPHTTTIQYTASSSDLNYSGKTASLVANINDDDAYSPGLMVTETDGSTTVTEGGDGDSYTLVLTSKPTANVKIRVASDNTYATASAGVFWFLPTNWNVPQTVTISANNNTTVDAARTTIFSHILYSTDPRYMDLVAPTVNITVNDDDGARAAASAADAKPPQCSKTPPYSAPHLFQINARTTQATLYFTPLRDNIDYYFIAYGYTQGDNRFGVSFPFGSYDGVIDYTINMLDPGSQYYFSVRGGNGCATGPWSNWATATTPATGSASTRIFYASSTSGTSGSGGASGSSSGGGTTFTRNLYPGSRGEDVRALQRYLNSKGFTVASSGAGSPGNETDIYGNLTAIAVRRFQEAHFAEILNPLGYSSGTGIFGPSTRAYVNSHP